MPVRLTGCPVGLRKCKSRAAGYHRRELITLKGRPDDHVQHQRQQRPDRHGRFHFFTSKGEPEEGDQYVIHPIAILYPSEVHCQSMLKFDLSSTSVGSIGMSARYTIMPVPSYKVSKAALNMLTVQWAHEYQDQGFTFMAISPGVSYYPTPI